MAGRGQGGQGAFVGGIFLSGCWHSSMYYHRCFPRLFLRRPRSASIFNHPLYVLGRVSTLWFCPLSRGWGNRPSPSTFWILWFIPGLQRSFRYTWPPGPGVCTIWARVRGLAPPLYCSSALPLPRFRIFRFLSRCASVPAVLFCSLLVCPPASGVPLSFWLLRQPGDAPLRGAPTGLGVLGGWTTL